MFCEDIFAVLKFKSSSYRKVSFSSEMELCTKLNLSRGGREEARQVKICEPLISCAHWYITCWTNIWNWMSCHLHSEDKTKWIEGRKFVPKWRTNHVIVKQCKTVWKMQCNVHCVRKTQFSFHFRCRKCVLCNLN